MTLKPNRKRDATTLFVHHTGLATKKAPDAPKRFWSAEDLKLRGFRAGA